MTKDEVFYYLEQHNEITEPFVLVHEMKCFIGIDGAKEIPRLGIKIYKINQDENEFSFDVSYHIHTPIQATPYYPSRTYYQSEDQAIAYAISSTTQFIKAAIRAGHEPKQSWAISNDNY